MSCRPRPRPTEPQLLAKLRSLHVRAEEAAPVSLSWLLDEDNALFLWLYNNLSELNSLSPEEVERYRLVDADEILEGEQLENALAEVKSDGISLPDDEGFDDVDSECAHLESVVSVMREQMNEDDNILEQERQVNFNIAKELEMINILLEEENRNFENVQKDCETLIEEAKNKKLDYCNTITDLLDSSAKKKCFESILISEQPLEIYFEKTKLLQSYLKLYLSRQFSDPVGQESFCKDRLEDSEGMHSKIIQSCKRLEEALWSHSAKKASVEEIQSQIDFIRNYQFDQCCDLQLEIIKCTGEIQILLENLKLLCEDEVQQAIDNFIRNQSKKIMYGEFVQTLEKNKYLHNKLCDVDDIIKNCLNSDTLLYVCLNRDFQIVQSLNQLSSNALNFLKNDIIANKSRSFDFTPLKCKNYTWDLLQNILNEEDQSPEEALKKLSKNIAHLETSVFQNHFSTLHNAIKSSQGKALPLKNFIWDGPTLQPNIISTDINLILYELNKVYEETDRIIKESSQIFLDYKTNVKKEPKLNKLWVWFLAGKPDEFIKELQNK